MVKFGINQESLKKENEPKNLASISNQYEEVFSEGQEAALTNNKTSVDLQDLDEEIKSMITKSGMVMGISYGML